MDISQNFLFIILVLSPGFVAHTIYRKIIGRYEKDILYRVIETAIFALFSYFLSYFLFYLFSLGIATIEPLNVFDILMTEVGIKRHTTVNYFGFQYAATYAFAVMLAFAGAFADDKNLLNRLARYLGISKSLGYRDCWEEFFNRKDTSWIYLRDLKNNLVYFGFVEYFSFTGEKRSIVLKDVTVYRNLTDEEMYKADSSPV